ncbi:DUF4876 domain-containing protein [Pseudopedobacter beijingensis]|uniref:DUF4876 domain-containing protein n=1 Tax=Pseudopedobacter beijingensis TaxID=1207056 RepID=A0ABW4ICY6_9SPHI
MNTIHSKLLFGLALLASVTVGSCKKDSLNEKKTDLTITYQVPETLEAPKVSNITVSFTEVNSKINTQKQFNGDEPIQVSLPEGSYEVTFTSDISYTQDGKQVNSKLRGRQGGVILLGENAAVNLKLFLYDENANFVIKELYFTGSVTPEGKQYNGDKYYVIYNNSADTLYADGLMIAQITFLTTTRRDYTPDIMNEAVTVSDIAMIPGTGKQYPVAPGKQVVIADNGINHLEYNSNSIDLTSADFEMELLSSINIDNPQVTNMIPVTASFTTHNRGFKGFILAKIDKGIETFKADNYYTYKYFTTKEMSGNGYKIENKYILDAVNLSVADSFEWITTSPALDMGWTHCGTTSSDANRYGKSVRRKVISKDGDREILKDTNNSSVDFDAEVVPSLKK